MEAEFTVTGAVPEEVSVSDCVVAVFTVTPPKLRLAVLTVKTPPFAPVPCTGSCAKEFELASNTVIWPE
jgi:hypothetical protein